MPITRVRVDVMKESAERVIEVGYRRNPRKIFDEMEQVTAGMIRKGWKFTESLMEDGLENIHLFFEREISEK